jgi:hypothetical protein
MMRSSGRQRALWGLLIGLTGSLGLSADEPARLPAQLQIESRPLGQLRATNGSVVVSEPLTVEAQYDGPVTPTRLQEAPPPASSTGQQAAQPAPIAPVPTDVVEGDPHATVYRDRPVGNKKQMAATIANNRSSEPSWYREWRINHYGYYPTQWRPWPAGWHGGRNLEFVPSNVPLVAPHPYDLRQPPPDVQLTPPKKRVDKDGADKDKDGKPADRAAPPLKTLPKESSTKGTNK